MSPTPQYLVSLIMKYLSLVCLMLLVSCNQKTEKANKNLIELSVFHEECTGCLDATIVNKPFKYPDSIQIRLNNPNTRDILLDGKNPYEDRGRFLNVFATNYLKNRYKIFGYFSRVDSINNLVGKVAVFYVVKYERLK